MFVFAGSKRHTMSRMFNSPNKPFYQSAISMSLNPIPINAYCDFAVRLFEERGKHIEREVIEQVYAMFDGCTWYVQLMMNELFALTPFDTLCTASQIEAARKNIIIAQEGSYKDILVHLPPKQKLVLQAIAKERKARGITSSSFMKKYALPSASSVQSAIKGLLKSDLITQEDDAYRIYDYFFSEWLATEY